MHCRFLYRGVSSDFHQANQGLLRPKVLGDFTYQFRWDEPGFKWDSGGTWDSTPTNAVIRHQFNQEGYPTSGISSTPHLERAIMYARGKDGMSSGYVFKIDREALKNQGVVEFVVAQFCTPSIPEDDEVILVVPDGAHLPEAAVAEFRVVVALNEPSNLI